MPTRSPQPARVLPPPLSPETAYQRPELYARSPQPYPAPPLSYAFHGYPVSKSEGSTPQPWPPAAQWGNGGCAYAIVIGHEFGHHVQQLAGTFGDEPGASAAERDHGSGESNRQWILAGFASNDIAQCNTFRAGSSEVR